MNCVNDDFVFSVLVNVFHNRTSERAVVEIVLFLCGRKRRFGIKSAVIVEYVKTSLNNAGQFLIFVIGGSKDNFLFSVAVKVTAYNGGSVFKQRVCTLGQTVGPCVVLC